MDRWFDDLSRALAGGLSRRQALRQVGGGLAGALLAYLLPGEEALAQANECAQLCNSRFPPGRERAVCHSDCTSQVRICGDPSRLCVTIGGPVTCCPPSHICVAGTCVCPQGTVTCGNSCCPPGTVCAAGHCLPSHPICPQGTTPCDGKCCPSGFICSAPEVAGPRQCVCPVGTTQCGNVCCPNDVAVCEGLSNCVLIIG